MPPQDREPTIEDKPRTGTRQDKAERPTGAILRTRRTLADQRGGGTDSDERWSAK